MNAAKQLGNYVARNPKDIEGAHSRARQLATDALKADENFLAFALASPSIPMAVIQFRDRVDNTSQSSNRTFLSLYWKELGELLSYMTTTKKKLCMHFTTYEWINWIRWERKRLLICWLQCLLTGIAWNQTDSAQFWGPPFRDCGPLRGRWLWPFSVTVIVRKTKIVASSYIAADQDACNDALEAVHGKRHR